MRRAENEIDREKRRFLDADNMIITSFDNLVISRNRKIIFFMFRRLLRRLIGGWSRSRNENMKIIVELKRQQIYFNLSREFVKIVLRMATGTEAFGDKCKSRD